MQMAERYWLEGFVVVSRHRELSVHKAESVSIQRAIGFNKPKVNNFFSILKALLFDESDQQLIALAIFSLSAKVALLFARCQAML